MAVRDRGTAAAAAPGAAVKAGHLGRGTSLVDDYQLVGIETWRKFTPSLTSGGDVGPVLLGCVRGFFEGDGVTVEKAPNRARRKRSSRLGFEHFCDLDQGHVWLGFDHARDHLAVSLNAVRALIAALRLGACRAILAPFAHKAHCLARQKQAAE